MIQTWFFCFILAGCAAAPTETLELAWRLADHRDCATSGISAVAASVGTLVSTFRCPEGAPPASARLVTPGQGTLTVDGRSPLGALLYRGQLSLDEPAPGNGAPRTVTLYAVAAE